MKLLIAEDNAFFRNMLEQFLQPHYDLTIARDGTEAWAALQLADAPRLAILDWVMPGLNGPQICRRVRGSGLLSSMYLIIFTARNSDAEIAAGLRSGANDYITKPFTCQELRSRITTGEHVLASQDFALMQFVTGRPGFGRENCLPEIAEWPFSQKSSCANHSTVNIHSSQTLERAERFATLHAEINLPLQHFRSQENTCA